MAKFALHDQRVRQRTDGDVSCVLRSRNLNARRSAALTRKRLRPVPASSCSPSADAAARRPARSPRNRRPRPPPGAAGPDGGWPRGYSTRAAATFSSTSRRSRAGPARPTWSPTRGRVHTSGTPPSCRCTIRIEADTSVAMADRLVRFTHFQITEATSHPRQGPDPRSRDPDRRRVSGRRARHRPRPRPLPPSTAARSPRPQERSRGREAPIRRRRSSSARRPRCWSTSRRQGDLEPDQGQRPQVRGQQRIGTRSDSTSRRAATTCASSPRGFGPRDLAGPGP